MSFALLYGLSNRFLHSSETSMFSYTVDDPIEQPLRTSVEVTIDFQGEKRWLFFVTPAQLASVGDFVDGTSCRLHLGERHMIIISEISPEIINSVLQGLAAAGELISRTIPLAHATG